MSIHQVNAKHVAVRKIGPAVKAGQVQDMFPDLLLLSEMKGNSGGVKDSKPSEQPVQPAQPAQVAQPEQPEAAQPDEPAQPDQPDQINLKPEKETASDAEDTENSEKSPDSGNIYFIPLVNVSATGAIENKEDKSNRLEGESDTGTQDIVSGGFVSGDSVVPVVSGETHIASSKAEKDAATVVEGTEDISELFKAIDLDYNVTADNMADSTDLNRFNNNNNELINSVKGFVSTGDNSISTPPVYRYVDQGNLNQYVSQQIIHGSQIGGHTAKFRLSPAELGDVRLDISVNNKNVQAIIFVDNEEVKKMLEAGFNQLRDELNNQGLNVEQFKVEINRENLSENFRSMYDREEKEARKRVNMESGGNMADLEHLVSVPVSMSSRGGLSIFA